MPHYTLDQSYAFLTQRSIGGDDKDGNKATRPYLDPVSHGLSESSRWGVKAIDTLIPIMQNFFPKYTVYYAIEAKDEINAWISLLSENEYLIAVDEGALMQIVDFARQFCERGEALALSREEKALFVMWSGLPHQDLGPFENVVGEVFACAALAALIGHELGHAHERQLELSYPLEHELLINHGAEFAADGWAIRVAATIINPFFEPARKAADRGEQVRAVDLQESKLILCAFSFIDSIDLSISWEPAEKTQVPETHPVGTARLQQAAVALIDWWQDALQRPEAIATSLSVEAIERTVAFHDKDNVAAQQGFLIDLIEQLLKRAEEATDYFKAARLRYQRWLDSTTG